MFRNAPSPFAFLGFAWYLYHKCPKGGSAERDPVLRVTVAQGLVGQGGLGLERASPPASLTEHGFQPKFIRI